MNVLNSLLELISFVLVLILIVCAAWTFIQYNRAITLRNKVAQSFSSVDVYLQKRYDLIPNLVKISQAHAQFESQTLERLIELRNLIIDSSVQTVLLENDAQVSKLVLSMIARIEAYPELKAHKSYVQLAEALINIEDNIAAGRRAYNSNVQRYNTLIESFPFSVIAPLFSFKQADFFKM